MRLANRLHLLRDRHSAWCPLWGTTRATPRRWDVGMSEGLWPAVERLFSRLQRFCGSTLFGGHRCRNGLVQCMLPMEDVWRVMGAEMLGNIRAADPAPHRSALGCPDRAAPQGPAPWAPARGRERGLVPFAPKGERGLQARSPPDTDRPSTCHPASSSSLWLASRAPAWHVPRGDTPRSLLQRAGCPVAASQRKRRQTY